MGEIPREERNYAKLYPGLKKDTLIEIESHEYRGELINKIKKSDHYNNHSNFAYSLDEIEYCVNSADVVFIEKYLETNQDFKEEFGNVAVELFELIVDRIIKETRCMQVNLINNYYRKVDCGEKQKSVVEREITEVNNIDDYIRNVNTQRDGNTKETNNINNLKPVYDEKDNNSTEKETINQDLNDEIDKEKFDNQLNVLNDSNAENSNSPCIKETNYKPHKAKYKKYMKIKKTDDGNIQNFNNDHQCEEINDNNNFISLEEPKNNDIKNNKDSKCDNFKKDNFKNFTQCDIHLDKIFNECADNKNNSNSLDQIYYNTFIDSHKEKMNKIECDKTINHDETTDTCKLTASEHKNDISSKKNSNQFSKSNLNSLQNSSGWIDDLKCDICTHCNSNLRNQIIICNGCNLTVHQECYGVPNLDKKNDIEIVSDQYYFLDKIWFCRKCLFFNGEYPRCKYCPLKGNAYKQIYKSKRWGHVLCALFTEELSFSNTIFMEPIEELKSEITAELNKKISCHLCDGLKGYKIKCGQADCEKFYHVTCGINQEFYYDMKNYVSYCRDHNPLNERAELSLTIDFLQSLKESLSYDKNNIKYPKLKHKPIIRSFQEIKTKPGSFIMKVKTSKLKFTDFTANRILTNDINNLKNKNSIEFLMEIGKLYNSGPSRFYDYPTMFNYTEYNWQEWDERRSFCRLKSIGLHDLTKVIRNHVNEYIDYEQIKCDYAAIANQKDINIEIKNNTEENVSKDKFVHWYWNEADYESELNKAPSEKLSIKMKSHKATKFSWRVPKSSLKNHSNFINVMKHDIFIDNIMSINNSTTNSLFGVQYHLLQIIKSFEKRSSLQFDKIKTQRNIFFFYSQPEYYKKIQILEELKAENQFNIFLYPVNEYHAPNYYSLIKNPMCFTLIEEKIDLEDVDYLETQFNNDILLIISNCKFYNANSPKFYRIAENLEKKYNELMIKYKLKQDTDWLLLE